MAIKSWRKLAGKAFRILMGFMFTAVAVAHVLGYAPSEVVKRLDYLIYDVRLKADARKPEIDPRVIIVDIDEKSLGEVGRWPWSRDVVANMVTELTDKLGVAVVAFDVVFAEPQASDALPALDKLLTVQPELKQAIETLKPDIAMAFDRDRQLAEVLEGRPVVLGYYLNQDPTAVSGALPQALFKRSQLGDLALDSTTWQGYGANLPVLQRNAEGGYFNPMVDEDGSVRSIPLIAEYDGAFYQSFALATLRRALGNPQLIPVFPDGVGDDYGALEMVALRSPEIELDIPVERGLLTRVHYRATGGPDGGGYRYVSASDVLAGGLDPTEFEGRIVLVGTTAPGLLDLRSTPVSPVYPGVEVHANVLSAMLDGEYKMKPEYAQGLLFITVLAVGGILSLLMPILSPTWSLLVAVLVAASSVAINSYLYFEANLVLPVAVVLLLVLAIFMFDVAYGYLAESRSKRQMVDLFGEYVAPELVTEMADDPKSYSMEGESRELTVLFSDVRGFTTISESLEPNELREYINEYLTVMSEIIRAHRGTLDKYIGDAIMAFWGAPIADADHATLATKAAMAMQDEAVRLNERLKARKWPELAIGVGVNTGQMRVGDMGSKIRRAYTVMGDAVNLGSRLEGITKTYGVGVIVGENTKAVCPDLVFQELDAVRVKGKNEPVFIYAPLGERSAVSEQQLKCLGLWETMLKQFKAQQWDEAKASLDAWFALAPEFTVLYALYTARIEHFKVSPPPENWDGVTQFDTK
ncbi:CHASE2 domain-containing protein [Limnobacter sp.]|uniref:CHASE2 domain-containing protein n=1 Tax=Limnobacter sp. TaxID=2003368 RepID=UPI003518C213